MSRGRGPRRLLPALAATVVVALACLCTTAAPADAGGASAGGTGRGGTHAADASAVPAADGSGTSLSLVNQSDWVVPSKAGGSASFTLTLAVPGAPPNARVVVALYNKLHTRSGFEATLRSSPGQAGTREIDHTSPTALSALGPAHGDVALHLTVRTVAGGGGSTTTPGGGPLDLGCSTFSCTGVYPVVVSLLGAGGDDLGHFTTYLTYVRSASQHPMRFAWVVPVSGQTHLRTSSAKQPGLSPLPHATATGLEHLIADLHQAGVPVTLEAVPQTVQALAAAGPAGKAAVATLATMSTRATVDETVAQTYVPVDLGALARAGESTELTAQVKEATQVLQKYKIAVSSPSTWVTTGKVGSSTGEALAQLGAQQVVVPDDQLSSPPRNLTLTGTRQGLGTWALPFTLSFPRGPTVPTDASDSVLTSQFTADPGDPALAAVKLLADVAMVHFESPNAALSRGMVAVPPRGWHPSATFDRQLLAGLKGNPVVQPVTLSSLFATAPTVGAVTRHLQGSSGVHSLPASLTQQLSAARVRLNAFERAVRGDPALLTAFEQALLATEADYRSAGAMRSALGTFTRTFQAQLSQVTLSTGGSITLTSQTGWIPVTVQSTAHYTIRGNLVLSSAKFKFPPSGAACGGKQRPSPSVTATARSTSCSLVLDHPTNAVRIDVVARTLGDSPVTVEFSVPGLVFARGTLTVRSTATSVVGIVLTAVALAVLLGWWARTWRTGRRRRRAARQSPARGA